MAKTSSRITLAILLIFVLVPSLSLASTLKWSTTGYTSMEHGVDYRWGISGATLSDEEYIVSASLDITNLNNWQIESDYMNIYLLNNYWSNATFLTKYSDTNEITSTQTTYKTERQLKCDRHGCRYVYVQVPVTVTVTENPDEDFHYDLTALQIEALTLALSDSTFGIGFDPNCHYYDTGITFTITTATDPENEKVPEPATMLLLGFGLAGIAAARRKLLLR